MLTKEIEKKVGKSINLHTSFIGSIPLVALLVASSFLLLWFPRIDGSTFEMNTFKHAEDNENGLSSSKNA